MYEWESVRKVESYILNRACREDLTEKTIFEQRPKGGKGMSLVGIEQRVFQSK